MDKRRLSLRQSEHLLRQLGVLRRRYPVASRGVEKEHREELVAAWLSSVRREAKTSMPADPLTSQSRVPAERAVCQYLWLALAWSRAGFAPAPRLRPKQFRFENELASDRVAVEKPTPLHPAAPFEHRARGVDSSQMRVPPRHSNECFADRRRLLALRRRLPLRCS